LDIAIFVSAATNAQRTDRGVKEPRELTTGALFSQSSSSLLASSPVYFVVVFFLVFFPVRSPVFLVTFIRLATGRRRAAAATPIDPAGAARP